MLLSLPPSKSLVLTCLPVLFLALEASSSYSSPLISLHIYVTVFSCQRNAVLDPLLLFPLLLTPDNFTTDYMQFSKVSCTDNSLILFPPINLTSLSSNQSSVHSLARSSLMPSYHFTCQPAPFFFFYPCKSFHLSPFLIALSLYSLSLHIILVHLDSYFKLLLKLLQISSA